MGLEKVTVPKLDAGIAEGMIGAWLRQEGERVRKGDPLAEFVTDKATFEIESPADGVLLARTAAERDTVPVGTILCVLGEEGETPPDVSAENAAVLDAYRKRLTEGDLEDVLDDLSAAAKPGGEASGATPAARRLARREGIDIAEVVSSGGGPVTEEDVRTFLEGRPAE